MTENNHKLPFDPPKTPFEEGFNSASYHDGGETMPCPYPDKSQEWWEWLDGFSWYDDSYYL